MDAPGQESESQLKFVGAYQSALDLLFEALEEDPSHIAVREYNTAVRKIEPRR